MEPFVTPDELVVYMKRPVDVEQAALILAGVSGKVREFCGWQVSAQQETLVVDGSGTTILNLPTLHVIGVDEVRVDGVVISPASELISDGRAYRWSVGGQLYRAAGWPSRFRCVEVDLAHGFDETRDAIRAVVFALASRAVGNPENLHTLTVGGVTRTYNSRPVIDDLSELHMAQLSAYRLP